MHYRHVGNARSDDFTSIKGHDFHNDDVNPCDVTWQDAPKDSCNCNFELHRAFIMLVSVKYSNIYIDPQVRVED